MDCGDSSARFVVEQAEAYGGNTAGVLKNLQGIDFRSSGYGQKLDNYLSVGD